MTTPINVCPRRAVRELVSGRADRNKNAQGISILTVKRALSWTLRCDRYLRNSSTLTPHAQMQRGKPGGHDSGILSSDYLLRFVLAKLQL